jgi:hypothetical protein
MIGHPALSAITPSLAHLALRFDRALDVPRGEPADIVHVAQQLAFTSANGGLDVAVKLAMAGRYWGAEDTGDRAFSSIILLDAIADLLCMAASAAAAADDAGEPA